MNPLSIAALLFQSGLGIDQLLKGNSLADTPRPTQYVPQGVTDATNLDRSQAASPFLPNYGFASNQIAGNTASAYNKIVQNSPSSATTLGNIGNLYANANNQQQDLLMKGIDRQDKMKSALSGQLNNLGQLQNQAWQWNEADPYLAAMKAANVQTTTGEKNIFSGLETGGSALGLQDLYNKLLNKNGGGAANNSIAGIGNGGVGGNNGGAVNNNVSLYGAAINPGAGGGSSNPSNYNPNYIYGDNGMSSSSPNNSNQWWNQAFWNPNGQ